MDKIKIHYSLLPAFDCDAPMKEAFISGVKVSGVTIYSEPDKKILAQYPVLITNSMHYDEFEKEMIKTGDILYKKVLDCIEQDKVFDVIELFEHHSCCNGCNHSCH